MCKELKPVNNLDELFYQFYVNLDSDCLFKMRTGRLEKKWGTKVLDRKRLKPGQVSQLFDSTEFAKKPYNSEKDAFFIERIDRGKDSIMFRIIMTNAYSEKHHTLFPDRNFPKLIPKPLKRHETQEVNAGLYSESESIQYPRNPGVYWELGSYIFYWVSSDNTREIFISGVTSSVTEIIVHNGLDPNYVRENLE